MTLDQDIWSFGEYNSNCDLIHNRLNGFWALLNDPLTSADNNKMPVRRGSVWSYEAVEIYDGLYQEFLNVSGSISLELNSTTSRSAVILNLVGETLINDLGVNLLSGMVYTFFIKQDAVGGRKLRWPELASVLGVIDETPDAITVSMLIKLPNGSMFVKNQAYMPNNDVGYYEFRVSDDYEECNKADTIITGNVLTNDWGGNLSVVKVNGLAINVGNPIAGSSGGIFTINSDGSYSFNLNAEFEEVEIGLSVDTSATYTASNGQEELTATLNFTVLAEWQLLTEANVLHWFDLSKPENYVLNGSTISQLNDLSGNGYHLVQVTPSAQPTLVVADLNGMNAMSFDGGDALGQSPGTWFTERDRCIFYVVKGTRNIAACGMTTGGTCLYNNNPGAISSADQGGVGEQIGPNGFAAYQHNPNVICNLLYRAQTLTGYNIIVYKWEARKPTGFLNGIPYEIGVTANQGTRFYLYLGGGAYGTFTGNVTERVITDGIPTQEVFDKIVGNLAHKWALIDKLQFNHPYKVVRPGARIFEINPDISYAPITATRSGNVLTSDKNAVAVSKVNSLAGNVDIAVNGSNGGVFIINANGTWSFDTNGNFDGLSGTQFVNTSVNYTATNTLSELTTTLTVRVLANYYAELEYDGGGWTLLTDEHILPESVQTYSFDPATREFSQQATTPGSSSAIHFGCAILLGLGKSFSEVRVFHSGGSGYSCAGVVWNNFIYGGNEDLVPENPHTHYPGWYAKGCDLIKNTVLVDGWNTRTMLYPGTRLLLGMAGYTSCTRVVMKNIVMVR